MKAKATPDERFVVRVSDGADGAPVRYAIVTVSRMVTADPAASAEDRTLIEDLAERFRKAGGRALAAIALDDDGAGRRGESKIEVKGLMASDAGTSTQDLASNGTSTDQ